MKLVSCASTLLAVAATLLTSTDVVDARLVLPSKHLLNAYRLRLSRQSEPSTAERIQSYFQGSAFPRAGRSLQQKLEETEKFLAQEIPKSGIVGIGAAIVYENEVVLSKGYGLRQSNDSSKPVTNASMFQIGSVTKTMLAAGIGLLVEDGTLQWRDPVKKHLPWLKLVDKYAEKFLNIGDLLSMNSGYGGLPDIADYFGQFHTEREHIEAMEFCEPEHSLREKPEYANVNFVILGQLIEHVTGLEWPVFMRERLWAPLGMNNTFASANLVPVTGHELSDGHFACGGEVLGPYNLVTSVEAQVQLGRDRGLWSAGSVVSSAADMATFMSLLLTKGTANGVQLFKSPATIAEMVTGKVTASTEVVEFFSKMGLHYSPDGGMIASGYGIDIIGQSIWGHAYYDKSGDLTVHQTRTGFAPDQQLGVIFMGNTQVPSPHATYYLDHYRTYIMGIFLDVPKEILDFEYSKWQWANQLEAPFAGAPRCGLQFWKNPPTRPLSVEEADAIVGTYVASISEKYFAPVVIARGRESNSVTLTVAKLTGTLAFLANADGSDATKIYIVRSAGGPSPVTITVGTDGKHVLNLGIDYLKQ